MSQSSEFLTAFFAGMPAGQNILVWTKQDEKKVSYWSDTIPGICTIADRENKKHQDVYFGVGSRRYGKHIAPTERGKDSDVAYLYAMWVDIDWKSEAHQKENLPEDEDEAMCLLEAVNLEPSILVRSGHGLQAFWLLTEPLTVGLGAEAAKQMTARWNYTFKKFAQRSGWDVDSVFDLARVMRLPGGRNVKHGGDLPVDIVYCNADVRYTIDELMEYAIPENAIPDTNVSPMRAGSLTMSMSAQYNNDKFEALCENNDQFLLRWMHKKSPGSDNSMSSYDMSIAAMAAYAEWSIQEIVDLLISHRRKYKDLDASNKEQRFDYLERTARKAWHDAQDKEKREAAKIALVVRSDEVQSQVESDIPMNEKETWEAISVALRLDVKGIEKYIGDEPMYRILIGDKSYDLGSIENITSWSRFQNRIATHTGRAIPVFKTAAWSSMWSRMLMSATTLNLADGGSADILYRDRFDQWIATQQVVKAKTEFEMTEAGIVYLLDNTYYFLLDEFYRWLRLYHHDTVTRAIISRILRQAGARPKHCTVGSTPTSRSSRNMWRMGK